MRSSRQGAKADGALCLPPCPQRLPLLFPKNLVALRFSGALIDAPCWRRFLPSAPRIAGHTIYKTRGAFTSIRMLIREKRKKCHFSFFERLSSRVPRRADACGTP